MIAAGVDFTGPLHHLVILRVTPMRGIELIESRAFSPLQLDRSSVRADVIALDRWNFGCGWSNVTRGVSLSYAKKERERCLEAYRRIAYGPLLGIDENAGVNALIAAFGTDWIELA